MKIRIVWNNVIIAESENFKIVESHYYFPPYSVQKQYLKKNEDQHISRWKGVADCYDIVVGNKKNKNAALVYSQPNEGLEEIEGYFSFRDKAEIVKEKNTPTVATNLPAGRQGSGEVKKAENGKNF